ncbi:MAG: hypothetical protein KGZ37_07755 [Nitrosarchaeum sp.]|nr:hypothetical protein [Nitrosarchaeum sp.]
MKKLLVAIIGAIIAVGGVVSASIAMEDTTNMTTLSVSPIKSAAGMLGHVTLTAYDENGNIKAYRQTDNTVLNQMDDCLSQLAFTVTSGASTCTNLGSGLYNRIVVGQGTAATSETMTALNSYIASTGSSTGFASAVMTPATTSGGASVLITSNFAGLGSVTVSEAALQAGSTTTGTANEAAIQVFTGIPLGTSDTLQIQWTVTIDGN